MADKHPSGKNLRDAEGSVGNLGQKKAEREEISDEKMSHMEKNAYSPSKTKEKRPQHKSR
ncbi:MAG: hypothetical protein R3D01_14565 [Hyphomicrobiales bacterium]